MSKKRFITLVFTIILLVIVPLLRDMVDGYFGVEVIGSFSGKIVHSVLLMLSGALFMALGIFLGRPNDR